LPQFFENFLDPKSTSSLVCSDTPITDGQPSITRRLALSASFFFYLFSEQEWCQVVKEIYNDLKVDVFLELFLGWETC
jgi:hypothetical protein